MELAKLTAFLSGRLQAPLPGIRAQQRMQARLKNGERIRIKHEEAPRKSGVLILLFEHEGQSYFPLIQRPDYDGVHSGQMALPGGKYEEGDDDQVYTAKRETWEEIGVDFNQIDVIGTLTELYVAASNYQVLPVIGRVNAKPTFVLDPKEVGGIVTPSVSQLINPSIQKEKEIIVGGGLPLQCPYFDLEGKTVWGATAMMLSELVAILENLPEH